MYIVNKPRKGLRISTLSSASVTLKQLRLNTIIQGKLEKIPGKELGTKGLFRGGLHNKTIAVVVG